MRKLLITIISVISFAANSGAQTVAVNSDLVMDALQTPSLGLEFTTGNSTTLSLNAMGNYKPWGADMKMIAIQPEWRYYLSRRAMSRHFIGLCLPFGTYKVTGTDKVYDGYGVGVGVTFGYVLSLSRRWNIDFHAGVQNFFYKQKELFKTEDPTELITDNSRGSYFLPTRIGISIAYILD
ncbi:DUF3575 domain-containing protein [Palleniella muris]|jgi:Protein of unknown function (DUF3575).|uniref:DUF3575 domain-containing protein n=1 Tax=Palleniella muris TaxID=3038145 RepID=A0AC61QPE8_9BACT|nr:MULTISPECIES: DUF3575 domain-containing protein [Palleniella]NPD81721.1 DUF3575 domain-containing protein [Palleniella intestinalis]TGX81489.1 DUF3575 domain-containing protein [Palleniella muris]